MSSCFFSFAVGTKPGKRHPQCQLQCRGPLLGGASGRGPPSVPPVGRGPRWARLCPVLGHCWREGEETIPRACFFLPPVVPLWPLGGVPLRPAVAGRLSRCSKLIAIKFCAISEMHGKVRRESVAGYATDETLACGPKEHTRWWQRYRGHLQGQLYRLILNSYLIIKAWIYGKQH